MAIRGAVPVKWTPSGASDTLDATNTFTGAMAALTNLIPDRTTRGLWVCRPASVLQTSFAGFTTPDFISAHLVVGSRVYGMISTTRLGARDEPFCFDLVAGAFIAIAGSTAANTPTPAAKVGAWVPPRMALIATKIIVTHPGFTGSLNAFGWIDTTNPNALTWSAGNTAGAVILPAVPVDVFNFGGRAYYAVNTPASAALVFSDILDPLTVTLGTQVITLDDNVPVTALGGLPLNNTTGAKVQTLVVFKGVSKMYLITGDIATLPVSTLQKNVSDTRTGTLAPNSICATTQGLAFASPDGIRIMDFSGNVSPPLGADGMGITVPFIYSVVPSRIAAACNGDTLRVSTQNGNAVGAPNQEFWFDFTRKLWSGPHTFAASLMQPYGNTFLKSVLGVSAKLFVSDIQQSLTSTFIENGVQTTFVYGTPFFPDTEQMCEVAVVESTIDLAYTAGVPAYTLTIADQNGAAYDTLTLTPSGTGTFWGAFQWGAALWLGSANPLSPRNLAWHQPIVFRRAAVTLSGQCSISAKFGTLRLRYQPLGYLQTDLGGST